jgi:hypothetical protein
MSQNGYTQNLANKTHAVCPHFDPLATPHFALIEQPSLNPHGRPQLPKSFTSIHTHHQNPASDTIHINAVLSNFRSLRSKPRPRLLFSQPVGSIHHCYGACCYIDVSCYILVTGVPMLCHSLIMVLKCRWTFGR